MLHPRETDTHGKRGRAPADEEMLRLRGSVIVSLARCHHRRTSLSFRSEPCTAKPHSGSTPSTLAKVKCSGIPAVAPSSQSSKTFPLPKPINKQQHNKQFFWREPKHFTSSLNAMQKILGASRFFTHQFLNPVFAHPEETQSFDGVSFGISQIMEIYVKSLCLPEIFPLALHVLTQVPAIISPWCFEVALTAGRRGCSGKAAIVLQKDRLLSGYN